MSGEWPFVVAAYALTWGTLLGYWGYLIARGRRARRTLESLLAAERERSP